jgi:hypothetical protein
VSKRTFASLKRSEARARTVALRRARAGGSAAKSEQRKASLVKGAARWQITNLDSVLRAMA